jgi:quercetin dioxygenase-like cupin family protein
MNGRFVLADGVERLELDWGSLQWVSKPALTGSAALAVCFVEIHPGKGHDFHKHPSQEEIIYVTEGSMEQWLGTEKQTLRAKDSVFIPKGTVHASFNAGPSTLKLLAVLSPCVGPEGYELVDVSADAPWSSLRSLRK